MATLKTINCKFLNPNGSPYLGKVEFILKGVTYTNEAQFVDKISNVYFTNSLGELTVELWANNEGLLNSSYICKYGKTSFGFVVPLSSTDPVSLSFLRTAGMNNQNLQYPTVVDFIADYLSNLQLGTADQILLNPVIPDSGLTVQSAIESIQLESTDLLQVFQQNLI
jgi:hypothetical protein